MRILEKLNQLKSELSSIRDLAVSDLPESLQPTIAPLFEDAREAVVTLGDTIEKHFQDAEKVVRMQVELGRQMAKDPMYASLTDSEKSKIIKKIIVDPSSSLISGDQLSDVVRVSLQKLNSEELIVKAYTRDEILSLGRALDESASSGTAYDAGLKVLRKEVETTRGFQEAMARAENRIMKDPSLRKQALLQFYGV